MASVTNRARAWRFAHDINDYWQYGASLEYLVGGDAVAGPEQRHHGQWRQRFHPLARQ